MDDLKADKPSSGLDYIIVIEQEELADDDIRTAEPTDPPPPEALSTETSENVWQILSYGKLSKHSNLKRKKVFSVAW